MQAVRGILGRVAIAIAVLGVLSDQLTLEDVHQPGGGHDVVRLVVDDALGTHDVLGGDSDDVVGSHRCGLRAGPVEVLHVADLHARSIAG